MPTKLTKAVSRETAARYCSREIILILAPCGGQSEGRIGARLKGKRTQYVYTVSDFYRWAAAVHAEKERAAKRAARKSGTPWKVAKKAFIQANSI